MDGTVLSCQLVLFAHHITVTCGLSCAAPVGANSLFSHCIQKAGFAFTSPGYSFYHWEAKAFDPGPEGSPLLLQALQNARMGSADDISLVCMAMPLFVHLCITAHCKATQTSPIIMLRLDSDQAQSVELCDQFLWTMQSSQQAVKKAQGCHHSQRCLFSTEHSCMRSNSRVEHLFD